MCIPHVCGFYAHKYEVNAKLVFATTVNEIFVKPQQHNKKSIFSLFLITLFQLLSSFKQSSISFASIKSFPNNEIVTAKISLLEPMYECSMHFECTAESKNK